MLRSIPLGWKSILRSTNAFKRFLSSQKNVSIKEALLLEPGESSIAVKGWVKALRKQKDLVFIDLADGTTSHKLQVILKSSLPRAKEIQYGAAISIEGQLLPSPKAKQKIELQGENVSIIGECTQEDGYPFHPRKRYEPEYVRRFPHLRPKTNSFAATLRLRSLLCQAIHDYLHQRDYVYIHAPIFTSNDCEGAGEVFTVKPASQALLKDMSPANGTSVPEEAIYFNSKVFLSVSGQLHLEAMTGGLSKVYSFGPTFRAENSRSRRHLAEFYMLEAELSFCDRLETLNDVMENIVKRCATVLLEKGLGDVEVLEKHYETSIQESLAKLLATPFATLSYDEAMKLLLGTSQEFKTKPKPGDDLGKEHELFLVEHTGAPTFIVDWPESIKPFYMRRHSEKSGLVSNVDLLVPGVGELCGGSLRENDYEVLKEKVQALGLQESLQWYLDLRKFGYTPTGGFGMGLERLMLFLLQIPNARDTIPFPRVPHKSLSVDSVDEEEQRCTTGFPSTPACCRIRGTFRHHLKISAEFTNE